MWSNQSTPTTFPTICSLETQHQQQLHQQQLQQQRYPWMSQFDGNATDDITQDPNDAFGFIKKPNVNTSFSPQNQQNNQTLDAIALQQHQQQQERYKEQFLAILFGTSKTVPTDMDSTENTFSDGAVSQVSSPTISPMITSSPPQPYDESVFVVSTNSPSPQNTGNEYEFKTSDEPPVAGIFGRNQYIPSSFDTVQTSMIKNEPPANNMWMQNAAVSNFAALKREDKAVLRRPLHQSTFQTPVFVPEPQQVFQQPNSVESRSDNVPEKLPTRQEELKNCEAAYSLLENYSNIQNILKMVKDNLQPVNFSTWDRDGYLMITENFPPRYVITSDGTRLHQTQIKADENGKWKIQDWKTRALREILEIVLSVRNSNRKYTKMPLFSPPHEKNLDDAIKEQLKQAKKVFTDDEIKGFYKNDLAQYYDELTKRILIRQECRSLIYDFESIMKSALQCGKSFINFFKGFLKEVETTLFLNVFYFQKKNSKTKEDRHVRRDYLQTRSRIKGSHIIQAAMMLLMDMMSPKSYDIVMKKVAKKLFEPQYEKYLKNSIIVGKKYRKKFLKIFKINDTSSGAVKTLKGIITKHLFENTLKMEDVNLQPLPLPTNFLNDDDDDDNDESEPDSEDEDEDYDEDMSIMTCDPDSMTF